VEELVKEFPDNPDALSLMGFGLRKTGRRAEALDYYGKALAKDPRHLGANEYIGELYVELGQLEKARERLVILEAACGAACEQAQDLAQAIAAAKPGEKAAK
jgi:predicted Zn-dependent protease